MTEERLDLLLVNAPSRLNVYGKLEKFAAIEPPVWAGLIARHCLNKGFTVQILDAEAEGMTVEDTAKNILVFCPRLAVFCIYGQQPSASTQCLPASGAVANLVQVSKLILEESIVTLALGTHPSALPERTLREEPFDYLCQGEGPHTITQLLTFLKGMPGTDPLHVEGLWSRFVNNKVIAPCSLAPNIVNLDSELPEQAWELLDMKKYRAHNWHLWTGHTANGYASVQTSLGCPFRCNFCCINTPFGGSSIRYWSPASGAAQIANLVEHYSITNFKIPDEMFVLNRSHVWQLCNMLIDMGLGDRLNIWAYARVDTVKDTQLLDKMRAAGFRWLALGIESGSKHVRDGVEKGRFGNGAIIAAVQRVQASGICVGANYIFGLPDDTQESMQQTLDLACELNTEYANFYPTMAYPGSPLHTTAREKGWRLPEDKGGPGWIGYSMHAPETLPLPTETLRAGEVLAFRDEAFLRYFSRPEYISMMQRKFGDGVVNEIEEMVAAGKPKRLYLGA